MVVDGPAEQLALHKGFEHVALAHEREHTPTAAAATGAKGKA